MNKSYLCLVTFLSSLLLLQACSYSVSVNDNTVYTPMPLFTDFNITDTNLRHCVEQTIADNKVTSAKQLTKLNCSNAGITDLSGLERFSAVQELNLASNKLQTLAPLRKLTQLQIVILYDNQLTDISPLLLLLHLAELNLDKNPALPCRDVHQLQTHTTMPDTDFIQPEQCRKN